MLYPEKVLIIDDDEDDIFILSMAFRKLYPGINIISERNSTNALTGIAEKKIPEPDIVFLDLNLPIIDGWECLRKLKAIPRYKTIPVVVYTTSSYKEDEVKALQLGASHFLTKPYIFLDICTALTRLFSTEFGSVQ